MPVRNGSAPAPAVSGSVAGALAPPSPGVRTNQRRIITTWESGHGWTTDGASPNTIADDSATPALGQATNLVVTAGDANTFHVTSPTFGTPIDLSASTLSFKFSATNYIRVVISTIELSNDGGSTWRPAPNTLFVAPEVPRVDNKVSRLSVPRSAFGLTSAISSWINSVNKIRFTFRGTAGQTATIRLLELSYRSDLYSHGLFSVMFHNLDGRNLVNGGPALMAHGWKVTQQLGANTNPANIDAATGVLSPTTFAHLTPAQLKELQDASGWQITDPPGYNGGMNNATTAADAVALEADIQAGLEWQRKVGLYRSGVRANTGQAPYTNATALPLLERYHTQAFWISGGQPCTETLPAGDIRQLRVLQWNSTTLAAAKAQVDKAADDKSWLIFSFGLINNTTSGGSQCGAADFRALLDYVASTYVDIASPKLKVCTVDEGLRGLV